METNTFSNISIKAYPNNYNIYIGNFLCSNLLSKYISRGSKVIILYDFNLSKTILPILISTLKNINSSYTYFSIKSTEKNKSFKTVNYLVNKILNLNINRSATIISLGGGITGDIAGFISSIVLRGINLINIPTTLLSAVDSSIGGKCGVNHSQGKNLIGSFYNPKAVIIDPFVFNTLSKRQLLSGYSEIIKCSLINNEEFFNFLSTNFHLLFKNDIHFMKTIIKKAILVKKEFVETDYLDTNKKRALLNFGHTFGHALEVINNYKNSLTHGEAVSIGMCMATKFSNYINLLDLNTTIKIVNTIKQTSLPDKFIPLVDNNMLQKNLFMAMLKDKKNTDKKINLVLLKNIGKALFVDNIPLTKVTNFINLEYSKCLHI